MSLQTQTEFKKPNENHISHPHFKDKVFSKDYVDFLNEAGWRLEKKLPSNCNNYSDLLEDTDWKYNHSDYNSLKHYRRDLDALS